MENNDSPLKPQPTGGLKLMTVFIAVLALHVVVIGGFTVYHLMSGGTTDADLLTDKSHKAAKDGTLASDGQMPDASTASPAASTTPGDASSTLANPSATASTAPATSTTTPTATTTGPATTATPGTTAANPLQSELAISPPDIAPVPATSAEIASGPVKMPSTQAPAPAPTATASQPEPETPASVAATPEPSAGTPYVVKAHDSLAKIAHHNHTTVAELKSANNLTSDFLKINQKLIIPAPAATATSVASTGASTAPEASGTTTVLTDSAPAASVPAPKTVKTAKSAKASKMVATTATPAALHHHTYTVVKGDTLTRIAHKFKTTPTAIMTANSITDPAKLSIGKKLKIPSSMESRSAKNTPAPVAPPAEVKTDAPTAQLANFVQ